MKNNKLTLNYKKSNYIIIGSNHSKTNKFKPKINHNTISQTNNVKYLGVFLDNQLCGNLILTKQSNNFPAPVA